MITICPHCEAENNAQFGPEAGRSPEDGDVSLCCHCFNLGIFEGGKVRKATDEEVSLIEASPDYQQSVRLLRASQTVVEATIKRWEENGEFTLLVPNMKESHE